MCYSCWAAEGEPRIINDRVLAAVAAVERLYDVHPVGGGMHIVTDDWNCEDHNVKWCRDNSARDEVELACLTAFEALTEKERYSALALYDDYFTAEVKE